MLKKLVHWLNEKITDYNDRHRKKKWHTPLTIHADIFRGLPAGLYLVNIRTTMGDFISRTIGRLTMYREGGRSAPISHTIVFYHGDIREQTGTAERMILNFKLAKYYRIPPVISEINNFVLCSADDSGMNYFDFSAYQLRDYSVRRLPVPVGHEREIIADFIRQYNRPYDVTGLIFWPIYRVLKFLGFLDDSRSWFCSEVCAEILAAHGIQIAGVGNPSPADIEACNHDWRIYMTAGYLR